MKYVKLLQADGTYVNIKPEELEDQRHRFPRTVKAVIPIPSKHYGPICTVASSFLYVDRVPASIIMNTLKEINVGLEMSFRNVDTPLAPPLDITIRNICNTKGSLAEWLMLYPALNMLESINSFIRDDMDSDKEVIVENVFNDNQCSNFNPGTMSDVLEFLEAHHLEPSVDDSYSYKFRKANHSYSLSNDDSVFDRIIIFVPGAKCGYYLTYKQYNQLIHVTEIEFYKGGKYSKIKCSSITDLLMCCLYLPQYIGYEQGTSDIRLDCKVIIHYDNQLADTYSMFVESNSRSYRNLNLFDLITY